MKVGQSTIVDGQENALAVSQSGRQYLDISKREWRWAVMFLLSMSLTGLRFYPAILISIVMLFHSWRNNRYDFVVMLTIFLGGFGMTSSSTYPIKMEDVALIIGFAGLVVTRKSPVLKRITIFFLAYVIVLYLIACTSDESMAVQIRRMRYYWLLVYLYVPLLAFAGCQFEIKLLFRKIFPYIIVITIFYTIDAFIFHGFVLMPCSNPWGLASTFYSPHINLFSFEIPRVYPRGVELWALAVIPILHYFKLRWWQWAFLILAFVACRTMTVISGLLLAFVLFQGNKKRILIGVMAFLLFLPTTYFVDKTSGNFLRVASTIDQFVDLAQGNMEREELGEFASGRMQQIIPKFERLSSLHREWLGFGFLHPEYSKGRQFFIKNDLYTDISRNEEVATAVEVGQLQTILDVGYLGLIIQTVFYIGVYLMIRRLKYANYYLSVLVVNYVYAIGGFGGLNQSDGLLPLGFSLGVVLLANKPLTRGYERFVVGRRMYGV